MSPKARVTNHPQANNVQQQQQQPQQQVQQQVQQQPQQQVQAPVQNSVPQQAPQPQQAQQQVQQQVQQQAQPTQAPVQQQQFVSTQQPAQFTNYQPTQTFSSGTFQTNPTLGPNPFASQPITTFQVPFQQPQSQPQQQQQQQAPPAKQGFFSSFVPSLFSSQPQPSFSSKPPPLPPFPQSVQPQILVSKNNQLAAQFPNLVFGETRYSSPSDPFYLVQDPSNDGYFRYDFEIVLTEMNRDKAAVLQSWVSKHPMFDKNLTLPTGISIHTATLTKGNKIAFSLWSQMKANNEFILGSYLNVLQENYSKFQNRETKVNYQLVRKTILGILAPVSEAYVAELETSAPALGGGAVKLNEEEKRKLSFAITNNSTLKLYICMYYGAGKIFNCVKPLYTANMLRLSTSKVKNLAKKQGFLRTDYARLLEIEVAASALWPINVSKSWSAVDEVRSQIDFLSSVMDLLTTRNFNQVLVPCSALVLKIGIEQNIPMYLMTTKFPAPEAKKVGRYVRVLGENVFMSHMQNVIQSNAFLPLAESSVANLWFNHCRYWSITRSNASDTGLTSNNSVNVTDTIKKIEKALNFNGNTGNNISYKNRP